MSYIVLIHSIYTSYVKKEGKYIKNISLCFDNSCAGCSHMHGENHKVSCDAKQLTYAVGGFPKIYCLDKVYRNPYQWPLPGIPYKDWLKAEDCSFFESSE